jgi:hypothetical protein
MTESEEQLDDGGPILQQAIADTRNGNVESDQGETEDEEVKRNCVMGQTGLRDSDFSDSEVEYEDENDDDKEDGEDEGMEDGEEGLVEFVERPGLIRKQARMVYRPTPIVPKLPPHPEENEEEETSSESASESEER